MKTLGLCDDETSSVCLFEDGKLLSAISEERFTRKKMDNSFPINAINWTLKQHDIELGSIDEIAYSWKKGFDEDLLEHYASKSATLIQSDPDAYRIFLERIAVEIKQDKPKQQEFLKWSEENLTEVQIETTKFFYHHEAHAYSAALLSPYEDSLVLTIDGRGDFESLTIYQFKRKRKYPLKKIFFCDSSDSLGFFMGE